MKDERDRRDYHRQYYLKNKPRLAKMKAERHKNDLNYRLRAILATIVQRCNDPRHASYRWYGGSGISNSLTFEDLKRAWIRDGADQMKQPSIDRIDCAGNYEPSNIEFVPFRENLARRVFKKQRVKLHELRADSDTAANPQG